MKLRPGRLVLLLVILGSVPVLAGCDWFDAKPAPTPRPQSTPAPGTPATPGPAATATTAAVPPTAVSPTPPNGTPVPQGGTLTVRLEKDVTTLNPFLITRSASEMDTAAQT